MANTLATPSWTTKEVARGFINKLVFLANVNRTYDSQYEISGAKVGNTVNARLPQRFTVTDGQALQLQNLYDQTVPISLTNQKNVRSATPVSRPRPSWTTSGRATSTRGLRL